MYVRRLILEVACSVPQALTKPSPMINGVWTRASFKDRWGESIEVIMVQADIATRLKPIQIVPAMASLRIETRLRS